MKISHRIVSVMISVYITAIAGFFYTEHLAAETNVLARGSLGFTAGFGQVGNIPVYGAPFLPGKNRNLGFEIAAELPLTSQIFLEPQLGYLSQQKLFKYRALATNINGEISYTGSLYDQINRSDLTFGLALKGKTKGIHRKIRFIAAAGFQVLRAFTIERYRYRAQNLVSENGSVIELAATEPQKIETGDDFNRWGLRLLAGFGVEYNAFNSNQIVLQSEFRVGFDLSPHLFQDTIINGTELDRAYYNTPEDQISCGLSNCEREKTFVEMTGSLYLGVVYRLPAGDAAKRIKADEPGRLDDVDHE